MKNILFFVFQLGFLTVYGQFGPQQIISSEAENVYRVIPTDVDNDGFIDVAALLWNPYKVIWFRNTDGLGGFGNEIVINDNSALYLNFEFVDLDSDGDKDILYLVNNPRKVAWLENINGTGEFGSEQILIENTSEFIFGVGADDLDNDGDEDLLILYNNTFWGQLVWRENMDGNGNFSEEMVIVDEMVELRLPIVTDMDSDGDNDFITSYEPFGPAKIIWLKNNGDMTFEDEIEIYQYQFFSDWTSVSHLNYSDINSDGIKDLAVTSHNDDFGTFYSWIEHLDGIGNFGEIQSLNNSGVNFTNYQFHDFDNDGDNDILSATGFTAPKIFWVENSDGLGSFSIERGITSEVSGSSSVKASDFNNDGLLDVVSGTSSDNLVAWYENTGVLNITEKEIFQTQLHPNPTKSLVNIYSSETLRSIELINAFGSSMNTFGSESTISLDNYPTGIYFLKCTSVFGNYSVQKVIKM